MGSSNEATPQRNNSWWQEPTTWLAVDDGPVTEESLAETFAYWHQGGPERIRYAARLDRWLVSEKGGRWHFDDSRRVEWFARRFLANAARCYCQSTARRIATAHMRSAIVDLARDTPDIAASGEELAEALDNGSGSAA